MLVSRYPGSMPDASSSETKTGPPSALTCCEVCWLFASENVFGSPAVIGRLLSSPSRLGRFVWKPNDGPSPSTGLETTFLIVSLAFLVLVKVQIACWPSSRRTLPSVPPTRMGATVSTRCLTSPGCSRTKASARRWWSRWRTPSSSAGSSTTSSRWNGVCAWRSSIRCRQRCSGSPPATPRPDPSPRCRRCASGTSRSHRHRHGRRRRY